MNPRLIALSGPLQGSAFEFADGEMVIGRDTSNWLCLADVSASRRHCAIQKQGTSFQLRDFDSRNGTFVNDVPVRIRVLKSGDRITIGNSLFVFQSEEESNDNVVPNSLDEDLSLANTTKRLRIEDAYYLNPQKLSHQVSSSRMIQDFATLMKMSTTVNSVRNYEDLSKTVLSSIFEVTPADRALLLLGEDSWTFDFSSAVDRVSGIIKAFPMSKTVLQQVISEKVSILCNDVLEADRLKKAQSLTASHITSLIAVPLLFLNKIVGVIYMDALHPETHFDEEHLQLLTAIAAITAVSFNNLRHVEWLEEENKRLSAEINITHNMMGESKGMQDVCELIAKVAPTDSTVFIRGESGTGKELAAHAVHHNSPRSEKPFVAINCAALTETLLESELFGHEKGAFTGALHQKKGKLELADGGTVFLDEVAELSPQLQTKLLRVLQEREFERVGGTRPIHIDIRLIAATNKNVEDAIKNHSFRQDLYYRLNVVSITMPALRERRDDIPLLATYFAAKYSKESKRRVMGISAEARNILEQYDWPGNVRELQNTIERAVVLGEGDLILPEDLPEDLQGFINGSEKAGIDYHDGVQQLKREFILKALQKTNGNYIEAAKLLNIRPNNLHRLIRNLKMKHLLKS